MKKGDITKTSKTKLKYDNSTMFLHCDHCLKKYLADRKANGGISKESPRDAMKYEAASYPFEYPDKTIENIMVVWCSKCGRAVWDSRHLTHRY